jgi:hypothetical protein
MRGGCLLSSRLLAPFDERQQTIQHAVEVVVDAAVEGTEHAISLVSQILSSHIIASDLRFCAVRSTIDLDGDLSLPTHEINEVRTDRMLSDELQSAEPAVTQSRPQLRLGRGFARSQRLRTIGSPGLGAPHGSVSAAGFGASGRPSSAPSGHLLPASGEKEE